MYDMCVHACTTDFICQYVKYAIVCMCVSVYIHNIHTYLDTYTCP